MLLGCIIKDIKKKLKFFYLSFIFLAIFTSPLLLNLFASKWDISPTSFEKLPKVSCVIVLGGFGSEDKEHHGYFNFSGDRFLEGLKIIESGHSGKILITGGNASLSPSAFREADWVKKELNNFNIPDSSILIENQSRNTKENATLSKKLLEQYHLAPPYILITSAFHMRRSLYIFKKNGMEVIPFPCNYIAGRNAFSPEQLIPNADVLSYWSFYIKEFIGYFVYKL